VRPGNVPGHRILEQKGERQLERDLADGLYVPESNGLPLFLA
jgi:hypothetical protein